MNSGRNKKILKLFHLLLCISISIFIYAKQGRSLGNEFKKRKRAPKLRNASSIRGDEHSPPPAQTFISSLLETCLRFNLKSTKVAKL